MQRASNYRTEHPVAFWGIDTSPQAAFAMLLLLDLRYVAVICANYVASKRFYTKALGLKVLVETYRAAYWVLASPESSSITS